MNKTRIIIGLLVTIVVIYIVGAFIFSQKVFPTTKLSDHNIEMITRDSLAKTVKKQFNEETIAISDEVVIDYEPKLVDLGASIDSDKLSKDIDENQNPLMWPIQIFNDQNYDLTKYIEIDEGSLNGLLVTDGLLQDSERTKSVNAKTKFDDKTELYVIKDEVYGNILNDDFKTDLIKAIQSGETEFDATEYYKKPSVTSKDLENDVDLLNSKLKRKITVMFGNAEYVIPAKDVATFIYINDDGDIDVDNNTLYSYLVDISADYDSAAKVNGKRMITIYYIDNAYYQIENGLLADGDADIVGETTVEEHEQDSRQTSVPTNSTYIEVSISNQYMWLYNDGELVLGTNVVTGNKKEGWDTPTGTFSVWSKETNKTLNGATVGFDYQVPVDYWMAIDYTGVGIHDIDWLTSANASTTGDVYLDDGSHGCINVPDDLMKKVYDNTPLGTPVYVMP